MSDVRHQGALTSVPAAVLVRVVGDLDVATAPALRETLVQAGARHAIVVADLSGVDFVDCCGLGALVHARVALDDRLNLYEPSATVLRFLDLAELRESFVIFARHA